MKFLDEYRDPIAGRALLDQIRRTATRHWTLMEVCGGQTHGLLRYGIPQELADVMELIHGPGCPVCVTPIEAIDFAQALALNQVETSTETARREILLTSFGDMLRVPGSRQTLQQAGAAGGNVKVVYSPSDAVRLAKQDPQRDVVFLAVGFETTAPSTALAVKQAAHEGLENFSLLTAHVRVQPAMEALMQLPDIRVEGFLAAGHVCTVMGYESYESFAQKFRVPVVVTGFEPLDLLRGILACVRQLENGRSVVENQYGRSVVRQGNVAAQEAMDDVFEIFDADWRGMNRVPKGGYRLRKKWSRFDARVRYRLASSLPVVETQICRSTDVLTGKIKPTDCEAFASACSPETPLGAPMVSSEGACAAYYRYRPSAAT